MLRERALGIVFFPRSSAFSPPFFYMCMRITLVRSWSHPDNATDVDKHGVISVRQVPTFLGVTTLLCQDILYRSNRAEALKEFPCAFE